MRASLFLIINALIVGYFLFRLFVLRKPQQPTPLDVNFDRFRERNLNCFFTFEGKKYDAYEVLGVPAGSPRSLCEEAYNQKVNSENAELLRAALNALQ